MYIDHMLSSMNNKKQYMDTNNVCKPKYLHQKTTTQLQTNGLTDHYFQILVITTFRYKTQWTQ